MKKVNLSPKDIEDIKALRGNMHVYEIATKYRIGYNRIYAIWKTSNEPIQNKYIIDVTDDISVDDIEDVKDKLDRYNKLITASTNSDKIIKELTDTVNDGNKKYQHDVAAYKDIIDQRDDTINALQLQLQQQQQQCRTRDNEIKLLTNKYSTLLDKYNKLITVNVPDNKDTHMIVTTIRDDKDSNDKGSHMIANDDVKPLRESLMKIFREAEQRKRIPVEHDYEIIQKVKKLRRGKTMSKKINNYKINSADFVGDNDDFGVDIEEQYRVVDEQVKRDLSHR